MLRKTTLLFMGVITFLLLCAPVFAEGFYIENYDVSLQVNKDKRVHITEHIDVYFTKSSHGIYREIPSNNATITNIEVSETNSIHRQGNKINIKIGDPNTLITGEHKYTISYDFNYLDNKNEFYHNIIGTDWDTQIHHVNFEITMPEEFNPDDVGISIGKYGVRGFNGGAEFSVDGLKISGQVEKILQSREGVTIRIALPEGYFVNENINKENPTRTNIMFIVLLCIITLVSFMTWYKFGKDEKAIPVVNFYPPERMNTLETEIAYKEKASLQGLVAMLISLAQRGYIQIHEEGKSFSLERLKLYDGTDKLEEKYIHALFSAKRRFTTEERNDFVTEKDLEESRSFYNECTSILHKANNKRNWLYEKTSIDWRLRILMAICLLAAFFITVYIFSKFNFSSGNTESFSIIMLAFFYFVAYFYNNLDGLSFSFLITLPFVLLVFFSIKDIMYNIQYIPVTIVGIVSTVICFICLYHLRKRNKKALKKLGHLLGFKKFIETSEKFQLEKLVYNDPQYFYNILPYAYLFGISSNWIKKFETIITMNPSWYKGGNFNIHSFNHLSNSIKKLSVPSTKNGGVATRSGGGGGFSGGGFGGGGGGRW